MHQVNPIYEFEFLESDCLTIVVSNLVKSSVKAKQNAVKWTMAQVIPSQRCLEKNCCQRTEIPKENHFDHAKVRWGTESRNKNSLGSERMSLSSDTTTDHVACAGSARCGLRSCGLHMPYKLCCMWRKPVWNIKSNDLGPDNAHRHLAPQPWSVSQESNRIQIAVACHYQQLQGMAHCSIVVNYFLDLSFNLHCHPKARGLIWASNATLKFRPERALGPNPAPCGMVATLWRMVYFNIHPFTVWTAGS